MTARIDPADVAAVVARLTEFGAHVEAATVTALATDLDASRLIGPQRDWWADIAASVGRSCVTLPDVAVAVREAIERKDAEIERLTDAKPMAWCVECDVDILTDGDTGDRCDWLVFFHLDDAIAARDAAIDQLVDDDHAADAESAEAMVRVLELVPRRAAIRTAPEAP